MKIHQALHLCFAFLSIKLHIEKNEGFPSLGNVWEDNIWSQKHGLELFLLNFCRIQVSLKMKIFLINLSCPVKSRTNIFRYHDPHFAKHLLKKCVQRQKPVDRDRGLQCRAQMSQGYTGSFLCPCRTQVLVFVCVAGRM